MIFKTKENRKYWLAILFSSAWLIFGVFLYLLLYPMYGLFSIPLIFTVSFIGIFLPWAWYHLPFGRFILITIISSIFSIIALISATRIPYYFYHMDMLTSIRIHVLMRIFISITAFIAPWLLYIFRNPIKAFFIKINQSILSPIDH